MKDSHIPDQTSEFLHLQALCTSPTLTNLKINPLQESQWNLKIFSSFITKCPFIITSDCFKQRTIIDNHEKL